MNDLVSGLVSGDLRSEVKRSHDLIVADLHYVHRCAAEKATVRSVNDSVQQTVLVYYNIYYRCKAYIC